MNAVLSQEQFRTLLDEMAARFAPAVAEKTRAALKDLGLTQPVRPRPNFAGAAAPETGARAFFRAMLRGDQVQAKALSEATGAAGGYLAPSGFREEIVAAIPRASTLAPHVRVVPVAADTGHVPSLAASWQVVWGGAEGAFNEVDPTVGQVPWKLKRADLLTKLSRELVADAAPSLVSFVIGLFQEALARSRDRMIAVGNGTTEPEGLAVADLPETSGVSGELTFAKLVAIEQSLPRAYRTNARWVIGGALLRKLHQLADANQRPLFLRDVVDGNPEGRLLGYPVAEAEAMPADTLVFGDLKGYLWFDREELGVESTTSGGGAFEQHQVWVKLWERADGRVGLPEAFVRATGLA